MKFTEIQRKLHQLLNEYEAAVIAENRGRNRSCYNEIENKYYQKRMELKEFVAELEAENDELKERVAMLDVTAIYKSLGEMGYIEQVDRLTARIAELEAELKITDELLKEATETIGAVVACCTYNSNDDAKIGIYGIDQKAFTRIDQFITHYNDAISAGKVSVDVKTSTDNNKRSKWKAYVPGWGAPTVNKRYLVKLINDWITIATYYLRVGGGYWKDDRGQELADGVVSLWKGLEE